MVKRDPKDIFREMGVRITPQRLEIYKILSEMMGHPAAEDVFERIKKRFPSISFDTIYRTLSLFEAHGLLKKVHHLADKTRYDTNLNHHHHFVCVQCKKIVDLKWDAVDAVPMPEGVERLGRVEDRYVELRGICSTCLKEKD